MQNGDRQSHDQNLNEDMKVNSIWKSNQKNQSLSLFPTEHGLFETSSCSSLDNCKQRGMHVQKWWKEKFGFELDGFGEVGDAEGVFQDAKEKAIKRLFGDLDQSFRFISK